MKKIAISIVALLVFVFAKGSFLSVSSNCSFVSMFSNRSFLAEARAEGAAKSINWIGWSEDIFERSSAEKKLVILDLEAVWCHWCHVMEEKTYSDVDVSGTIGKSFLAVRVDQDSRPDLASRYKEYGWPATIIFDSNGKELAKRAGFVPPDEMKALLKRLVANPLPEEENSGGQMVFAEEAVLSPEMKKELSDRHYASYDRSLGGLKLAQKYLEADSLEYALIRSKQDSADDREMATRTLKSNFKLIDPVWGGVYQYSTNFDWDHPHFEKIIHTQTNNLRIYALAYGYLKEESFLRAAMKVREYLGNFLTDKESGAFYTSQDADLKKGEHSAEYFALGDAERRKLGIPAIDKHIYARENGLLTNAYATLYSVTGDEEVLKEAARAAEWIVAHRSIPGGGFSHDEKDAAGPYLADTLEMGRGMLALYGVTGDRKWLERAEAAAAFIKGHFYKDGVPGFFASSLKAGGALEPVKVTQENINLARFANLLFHNSGKKEYRDMAEQAMKYLATEDIALKTLTEAGVLIVDGELARDPLHICVVGAKDDEKAKALFQAGMKYPGSYKRLEWWDKKEGPMPNPDVQYPQLDRSAAFICTNKRCSLPIFKPEDVAKTVDLFEKSGAKRA
jgi:uncharacterized protein YyaL (SSP411 family)